ncbi:MAG: SufS family cysteine desulfurase [Actinomycetota bacterium]|nr:SufS family cysteine desulfurase [Actinomycetota bacterium]
MTLDLGLKLKDDFPILSHKVRGVSGLVYLDSAATSQKPKVVIAAESNFYSSTNATVHRSGHELGELASAAYEAARENIARFVGIKPSNLIFTKNATEGINLVAYAVLNATLLAKSGDKRYNRFAIGAEDSILITEMEHHANIVPWQHLAQVTGARLEYLKVDESGRLDIDESKFSKSTKIVAITHQSNVLGSVTDVAKIVRFANKVGAMVVLDACQSVPHFNVDFKLLGVSAAAWSGHKMLGPTGVGCLYLNDELLGELPPFLLGGNMIENVTYESSTFRSDNAKFEAGTMNIAQVVGLSAAVDYLKNVGMNVIHEHVKELTGAALKAMISMPGIRILGPTDLTDREGLVSFEVDGVHPHDVSQFLDSKGVAVRAGHHCAWPLHRKLGAVASSRASFYLYNTKADVDVFLAALDQIRDYFKVA